MPTDALAETEAARLLGAVPYGRVAATLRAMPFVAPARHVVVPGALLLRMHTGLGYHRACSGTVVAYGADNLTSDNMESGRQTLWSVQCIGTATILRPSPEERALFGAEPRMVDGERFDPVYLRLSRDLTTVHILDCPADRQGQHAA